MKLLKRLASFSLVAATIGIISQSCKHEAGTLDKCLGKNIVLDTTNTLVSNIEDTTTNPVTLGEILIDTPFVKADIVKKPYYGSIDGGKSGWHLLPLDTMLPVGTYHLVVKDGDGCLSPIYTQYITY